MTQSKPPITVKIPPKDNKKRHHTPTEVEYWRKEVKKYGLTQEEAVRISRAAQQNKLNRIYFLELVMLHPSLRDDPDKIDRYAASESARLGANHDPKKAAVAKMPPKYVDTVKWDSYGTTATRDARQGAVKDAMELWGVDKYGNQISNSQYAQEKDNINELFGLYIGRSASKKELKQIIIGHWSQHKLEVYLSKRPGYFKGTYWKQNSGEFISAWETVYGAGNFKPPKELIRQAILRGKSGGDWFMKQIRNLPQYKKSVEYTGLYENYSHMYSQIYGAVGDDGQKLIDDAIMKRLTPDAFQALLRNRPEFATSFGMKQTWNDLGNLFGSIFGGYQPPIAPGQAGQGGNLEPPPPGQAGQAGLNPQRPYQHPPYSSIPPNARSGI